MYFLSHTVALAVLANFSVAAAQISMISSRTVVINRTASYYVPINPVATFKFGPNSTAPGTLASLANPGGLIPFSFITPPSSNFSQADLANISATWAQVDDVWTPAFLKGIYLSGNVSTMLQPSGDTSIVLASDADVSLTASIPPGPYFVEPFSGQVFEAWMLYNDEQQAFLYGTVPNNDGGFRQLSAHVGGASTVSVAVPSRIYFTKTAEKPLAGTRWAIKDLFDMKGLRTSGGSRAFFDFFDTKNTTAPSLQRLIDGGAVIVGKVKPSQFANGETATDDWVDFHAPYNPRGDGYQDASSSSTGSASAVASYPWLDYAVGTDTGGSMRGPSGACGIFGNRPSHGAAALDDVLPLSPLLDTMGIMARDAKTWQTAGTWLYENFTSFSKFPSKLLFPVDAWGGSFLTTPPANGTANAVFNTFIQKLEGFLNTTRTEMNVTDMWMSTSPLKNISDPPPTLTDTLNTTYAVLISLDQMQLLGGPFMSQFAAAHGGQQPFLDPAVLIRWGFGQDFSDQAQMHADAVTNKTVFMNWFQQEVLNGTDPDTCSPTIYLYPQSSGKPHTRNQYTGPPTAPFGASSGRFTSHAEVPDMVVPVGEIAVNSTVTMMEQLLPVTLSFVTQKNCDLMLFNLFAALQDAGIVSPVKTGSTMFA